MSALTWTRSRLCQSIVRFTGPFGLRMVKWIMRNRIAWTPATNIIRSGELDFDLISEYCYHNWALGPSGDIAVYTHLHPVRRSVSEGSRVSRRKN